MDPILLKCLTFLYQQVRQVQRDLLDQRDLQDRLDLQALPEAMALLDLQDPRDLQALVDLLVLPLVLEHLLLVAVL